MRLFEKSKDSTVREKAAATLMRMHAPRAYPASVVRKIEDLAALRSTKATSHRVSADGGLEVKFNLAGNGANWISIEPESD